MKGAMLTFHNHAFKGLDEALDGLHNRLLSMGTRIQEMTDIIAGALETADNKFIEAKAIDRKINEAELEANACVEEVMSKFNPMGEDLRFIIASIKIASLLERIADNTKNCVKRLPKVSHPIDPVVQGEIRHILSAVRSIVPQSLTLITEYTNATALHILHEGDKAEAAYKRLLAYLQAQNATGSTTENNHILLIAKNLERIADMALDIIKICYFIHFKAKFEKSSLIQGAQQ